MLELQFSKEFKKKRIVNSGFPDIEPQEVFLDRLAQKREVEMGISKKKLEVPIPKRVLQTFVLCIGIIFLVLAGTAFQFQIIEGKKYANLAEQNRYTVYSLEAERGVIYDRNGVQLVSNVPKFDLVLNKKELPTDPNKKKDVLSEVARILEENVLDIENKVTSTTEQILLVAEDIDHQKLIILETKKDELPGFEIRRDFKREYVDGKTFSQLIGYTGKVSDSDIKANPKKYTPLDYIGKDGLEKSYESFLRESPGQVQIERDVKNNYLSKNVASLPQSGNNLVLWVDSGLQTKIEESLGTIVQNIGAKRAAAVAMDPTTGGVLALLNFPEYDNNIFSNGDSKNIKDVLNDPNQPMFNRVISGLYPTGSTIKPLMASAALEEKIISPDKQIVTNGVLEVHSKYDPNITYSFHDWKNHGVTDMRKALAESNNIFFYTIGGGYKDQQGLGPARIKKYLEIFGWGSTTGIDLPGEEKGFIPSPEWKKQIKGENWWDGDTYNLSIGQSDLLITPLQVITAEMAFANGGKIYKPQVAQKVVDKNNNVIKEFSPRLIKENFVSPSTLQVVREGMRMAVTADRTPDASAKMLNSLPISAAAKTGTAQTARDGYYHNWITVFAPYDNPKIILTMVVESVKGVQSVTVPAAKDILEWYFTKDNNSR